MHANRRSETNPSKGDMQMKPQEKYQPLSGTAGKPPSVDYTIEQAQAQNYAATLIYPYLLPQW